MTVHGGQHDTKYVTFELLWHAALFVADKIWGGVMLEPARIPSQIREYVGRGRPAVYVQVCCAFIIVADERRNLLKLNAN